MESVECCQSLTFFFLLYLARAKKDLRKAKLVIFAIHTKGMKQSLSTKKNKKSSTFRTEYYFNTVFRLLEPQK